MGSLDGSMYRSCRICHDFQPGMTHAYEEAGHRISLVQKIIASGRYISPTDEYPKTVCQKCILELEFNYFFITTTQLIEAEISFLRALVDTLIGKNI